MTLRIRIFGPFALLVLALAGCDSPPPATTDGGLAAQVTSAYFAEDPALLVDAARAACQAPNEEFVRPGPGVAQCRLLMDPQTTAAVIVQFDGDIRQLPQLVVSLASSRAGEGYVVTGCAFLKVPRKDGGVARVVQADRQINAKLRQMLGAVGGKPVKAVPEEVVERCFSL